MSSISFVYFDLDDTLLDHTNAQNCALEDVHRRFRAELGDVDLLRFQSTYGAINGDVWRRYAAGTLTKDQAKKERFRRVLETLAVDTSISPDDLNTFYMGRYSRYWSYLPGAREAFLRIAARFGVGVLTNGFREVQNRKLEQFPELRSASSSIVISEEVGYLKPDRRLFDYAAERVGTLPESILYIGDSYRSDVEGGIAAGWNVCWFRPFGPGEIPGPGMADSASKRVAKEPHQNIGGSEGNPRGVRQFHRWGDVVDWLEGFE